VLVSTEREWEMGGKSSSTLWSESEAAARGRRTRRVMAADTAPAAEAIAGWNGRPARSGGRLGFSRCVWRSASATEGDCCMEGRGNPRFLRKGATH
jgi:hypothetical protein